MPDRAKVWSWFEYNAHEGKNMTVTTITRNPLQSHWARTSTFLIPNAKVAFKDRRTLSGRENGGSTSLPWSMACRIQLYVEIDRYIGLPIFFPIFKHFTIIGYRFWKKKISVLNFFFFFCRHIHNYTEQAITSSEICSLHLTHPSVHTLGAVGTHTPGAVDTVHSGEAPAQPPHVTLYKINLFETRWIILTFTIEPLFYQ